MELRHLRYLWAVGEEMHVTRAAGRLRIAQPALTQQIKALEAELDVQLLRRVGRRVELTEAGTVLWREAGAILERVRAAVLLAKETSRGAVGRLSIGLAETASFAAPVTAVLKLARERWPGVDYVLSQARSLELIAALLDRRLDVAFIRSPAPDDDQLEWFPFHAEGFVVVLPADHRLAAADSVPLEALGDEPLIVTQARPNDADMQLGVIRSLANIGIEGRVVQRTPEYVTAINLVAAGFGVTVVPAVLSDLRTRAVIYRPLRSDPPLRTQLIMVVRRGETSPVAANFLALASESIRDGVDAG